MILYLRITTNTNWNCLDIAKYIYSSIVPFKLYGHNLLTDFGDVYPASMKGVILGIYPAANIVDISHQVPHHGVHAGAFMLMACARYFPSGTVHIAVVDPGVGTKRRCIAIMTESRDFGIH